LLSGAYCILLSEAEKEQAGSVVVASEALFSAAVVAGARVTLVKIKTHMELLIQNQLRASGAE
jgi:3-hydroxymyristoyl/3-hydroxydecanoyl-(acyl carrier protein) dehydratase